MADRDFALPIGHDENNLSTVQMQLGNSYLQPVSINDYENTYSSGLEIWLPNTEEDRKLYASFNGVIKYQPSNDDNDFNSVELVINDRTVRQINRIRGLLEPPPKKVIYKNINEDSVSDTFETFINTKYQEASNNNNANNWHPVMRIEYNDQRIKEYLDDNSATLNATITQLVDEFIEGDIDLIVNCGEYIGDADVFGNVKGEIHEDVTYVDPRLIILEMAEYNDYKLNPTYYYWRLLKNANHLTQNRRRVTLITETTLANNTFDHPFLLAIDIDLSETILARSSISLTLPGQTEDTDDVLLFPVGKLHEWEGTNINNNDPSDLQWRITNDEDLNFEIRRRPNVAVPGVRLCGEGTGAFNACVDIENETIPQATRNAINNRVETIWTNYEDDIVEICEKLQVPVEIIVSIIGHESHGGERAIRFEPLSANQITELNNNPNIQNTIVSAYVDLTTQVNGQGQTINTGWGDTTGVPQNATDLNNAISPARSTITWNQAREVISHLPGNASPGIMQTLVSTATEKYNWLDSWYGNMADEFDIVALPQDIEDRYDWLLTARHSILCGAAKVKYGYCNFRTGWNPVLVYGSYNAGSRVYENNLWGHRFYDQQYVVDAGRNYNAFQNDIGDEEECRIRFWRNL